MLEGWCGGEVEENDATARDVSVDAQPAAEQLEPITEEEELVLSRLEKMALGELMQMMEHKSPLEPDPIPKLVERIGGESMAMEAAAAAALVNLSQDEAAAKRVVVAGAGQKAMERILTSSPEQGAVRETASKLLVNVSRIADGRRVLAGFVADGSADVQRKHLIMLINEYENSRKLIGDPLASLGFFFENMAQEVQGASILCNEEDFLLARLMKDLAGAHPDRMLGAAGAMKNCSFHSELHAPIASHRDLAALLCLNLVGSSEAFDDDDREGMQTGLAAKCRVGGKVSESGELRKTIYEAMKLLTRSRVGRNYLRQEKIYPVIREVHKFEEGFEKPDEESIEMLEEIVEQTMLCDEPDVD